MDLRDYPRPKGDTGIGVHWNAGYAAAIGLGQIEQLWLPPMFDMGIKWVKISEHDGAFGFVELLLKNDIMPIVRIYRPHPNPGTLGPAALAAVSDYVSAGVRYFEFNNEPDLGVEWRSGEVPLDGATISARNAIVDIEAILQRGGYPAIPALRPGGRWDLVGEICRMGRRDLLSQPVWQALHNYSANHPLDYPYDRVNQEGAPCSPELFSKLALEKWDGDAWEGWTLEQLNRFRKERANPGATAVGDPTCWRSYERYDQLIRNQIGRSLPILATENGYVVGERQDKRYPMTTPQLHAVQTLEACRIMMGTSRLHDPAPDYYFCTAYWLIGNFTLGSWAPAWENAAWFSRNWPGGQLPIVKALIAEPKQVRAWRGDGGRPGRLTGAIRNGPALPLTLRLTRTDGWVAVAQGGADGRFEFSDLPFDRFTLTIVEAGLSQEVALTESRPAAAVSFDLTGAAIRLANGSISGKVRGGAGMVLVLTRDAASHFEEKQLVAADSTFRFTELEPGTYIIKLLETSVVKAGIAIDGRNEVTVDLVVPGWGWQTSPGGATPGFGIVRCRVTGRPDLGVRLWMAGWSGMVQRTGSKTEFGPDACEFAPLGAGAYKLQPEGISAIADVVVDGSQAVWVTFVESAAPPDAPERESVLTGTVRTAQGAAAARRVVKLAGPDGEQTITTQDDGVYRFAHLPGGLYRVWIEGAGAPREGLKLDGRNTLTIDFSLPAEVSAAEGVIAGVVTNGAGRVVRLLLPPAQNPLAEVRIDAETRYRFDKLVPGSYTVQIMGIESATEVAVERTGIAVTGAATVQVDFRLPADVPSPVQSGGWEVRVEAGGATPGFSVVRCQVEGEINREVRLWTSGWSGIVQRTGSKAEYGPDVCEFAPLGSGRYSIEALGLEGLAPGAGTRAAPIRRSVTKGVRVDFDLEPGRLVWVRFRKVAPPPIEPPAPRSDSVIHGRVKGGAGRTARLDGPGGSRTMTIAADETYRFTGLAAGVYTLTALDSDPPTGMTQKQANIPVDGANTVQVDLDLGSIGPAKTMDHYLLVGSVARSKDDFVTALQYIRRFQPTIGTDEAEARKAHHVTILASQSAISAVVEQGLRMAGCQVQRVESDYAVTLGKLLAENRPY
jgi:hypothetical protein